MNQLFGLQHRNRVPLCNSGGRNEWGEGWAG